MNKSSKNIITSAKLNRPISMYNSDMSSSSSLSSNENTIDSPDSGVNYSSLPTIEDRLKAYEKLVNHESPQKIKKWNSQHLHSSTPKSTPPVPKTRRNIPSDVRRIKSDLCLATFTAKKFSNGSLTPKHNSETTQDDKSIFYTPSEQMKKENLHDHNFNSLKKPNHKQTVKHKRKMSVDGEELVDVKKLEQALGHLGIDPTLDQWNILMDRINVNHQGLVRFKDFTEAAKEIFYKDFKSFNKGSSSISYSQNEPSFTLNSFDSTDNDELLKLKKENELLKLEVKKMKENSLSKDKELIKKDSNLTMMKEKYELVKKENDRLEEDLKEAKNSTLVKLEHDYSIVAKEHLSSLPEGLDDDERRIFELQKRITILTCQLRKNENVNKIFEVAVNQLLEFAEKVKSGVNGSDGSILWSRKQSPSDSDDVSNASKPKRVSRAASLHSVPPPPYPGSRMSDQDPGVPKLSLTKHTDGSPALLSDETRTCSLNTLPTSCDPSYTSSPSNLVIEARSVISSVRNMLQTLPLPEGWEEGFTPEGNKFYIHHLTQTTSWLNPRSKMIDRTKNISRRSSARSEISWV